MNASSRQKIGTIRAKIGSVEVMSFLFFLTLLVISVRQFIHEDYKGEWIYIIFSILILITLLLAFVNFKSKTITLTKDTLTVERPLKLYSKTYFKDELKGFDLQEFYDAQIGVTRQIRIWTKSNKQIILVRDAYANYDRVLDELKKFGLQFLGTVVLKSRYKQLISTAIQIMMVLTMLMFAAAALVRTLK